MEKTRLEMLQETLQTTPDNPFVRYGLAMELEGLGRVEDAWEHFRVLLAEHPDYSATYLQAGRLLAGEGRREEAKQVLTKGLEVTARQGNQHAHGEIQATLDDLLSDE
jgi:tetratricopeptide (TPR) repeat protein